LTLKILLDPAEFDKTETVEVVTEPPTVFP
jgi:hypothetical protein